MYEGMKNTWLTAFIFIIMRPISILSNERDATNYILNKVNDKSQYNKLFRPIEYFGDKLIVHVGLRLSQFIGLDERNEITITRLWLEQEWYDAHLTWDPEKFNNVQRIHVPSDIIWLPEIVLHNTADGKREFKKQNNAIIYSNGRVKWISPAVFKSTCLIDVEYFPYDRQVCRLQFASSTYDGSQVELRHAIQKCFANHTGNVYIDYAVDLNNFLPSLEFDLIRASAFKNDTFYKCCPNPYPEITFNFYLRRKTLFFTVNLVLPCVGISFLTVLIFYLPSDSKEKISLSISILVSLTLFFLLMAETIPPTSLVVPLIGKYLLFTIVLVTLSITITVIVLNINFRSSETHSMPKTARTIFLDYLPRILRMENQSYYNYEKKETCQEMDKIFINKNKIDNEKNGSFSTLKSNSSSLNEERFAPKIPTDEQSRSLDSFQLEGTIYFDDGRYLESPSQTLEYDSESSEEWQRCLLESMNLYGHTNNMKEKFKSTIRGLDYIKKNFECQDFNKSAQDDWKYLAMVLDRLFLYLFLIACTISSTCIILRAPCLYDYNPSLTSDNPASSINVTFYNGNMSNIVNVPLTKMTSRMEKLINNTITNSFNP